MIIFYVYEYYFQLNKRLFFEKKNNFILLAATFFYKSRASNFIGTVLQMNIILKILVMIMNKKFLVLIFIMQENGRILITKFWW